MRRIFLHTVLSFFILPTLAFSQDSAVVKLVLPNNGIYYNLDKVQVFSLGQNQPVFQGAYRLTGENTYIKLPVEKGGTMLHLLYDTKNTNPIDLFFPDGDTVEIEAEGINPVKQPVVRKGTINKEYYSYLAEKKAFEARQEALKEKYNTETDKKQKKAILNQLAGNHKDFSAYCMRQAQENKSNLLGLLIANTPVRKATPDLSEKEQQQILLADFWKGINLGNTDLLKTPLFYKLLEQYVALYFSETYSPKQQDSALYLAIDRIMQLFSQTESHKNFAYSFLKNGFEAISHEKMVQYLAVHYQTPEQCSSEEDAEEVRKLQAAYEKLKKGNKAPEIELSDTAGKSYFLKDIEADTLLLVFWSSSCPHCTETLPLLAESLSPNWKVVAVSLDQHKDTYLKYISQYPDWIHYCDFNGWKSKPVSDYFVTGTPTFILLDSKRRIIEKFNSWERVKRK